MPDCTPYFHRKETSNRHFHQNFFLCFSGDQLGFILNNHGRLQYSKNGSHFQNLFTDLPKRDSVWLVFDIYGKTTIIKLMGILKNCAN